MTDRTPTNRRFGFGLVLVFLGLIFLLDNLNLIPYDIAHYLFSWQGILLIIGTAFLISGKNRIPGVILISIGVLFLLPDILNYDWFRPRVYWPLVLIVVGLFLIARRQQQAAAPARTDENDMDVIDDMNIFGGGEVVLASKSFKGGESFAMFGGSTYNLTRSQLDPNGATLDIFAMFGGSTFIVPADWNVKVEVNAIFGGFADKRTPNEQSVNSDQKLVITGTVIFGGGEVKSF